MTLWQTMDIVEAIAALDRYAGNPSEGLPYELFCYVSRLTPLVNVDLLIKDGNGRTLLAWRDDPYAGRGWHIPGGIVRFKETLETRVIKVAESEIAAAVRFERSPLAVNECIHPDYEVRGHFISFLYRCFLPDTFVPENKGLRPNDRGFLMWHSYCPDDLIPYHNMYRKYISLEFR